MAPVTTTTTTVAASMMAAIAALIPTRKAKSESNSALNASAKTPKAAKGLAGLQITKEMAIATTTTTIVGANSMAVIAVLKLPKTAKLKSNTALPANAWILWETSKVKSVDICPRGKRNFSADTITFFMFCMGVC